MSTIGNFVHYMLRLLFLYYTTNTIKLNVYIVISALSTGNTKQARTDLIHHEFLKLGTTNSLIMTELSVESAYLSIYPSYSYNYVCQIT